MRKYMMVAGVLLLCLAALTHLAAETSNTDAKEIIAEMTAAINRFKHDFILVHFKLEFILYIELINYAFGNANSPGIADFHYWNFYKSNYKVITIKKINDSRRFSSLVIGGFSGGSVAAVFFGQVQGVIRTLDQ